jgi:hypothetical protein
MSDGNAELGPKICLSSQRPVNRDFRNAAAGAADNGRHNEAVQFFKVAVLQIRTVCYMRAFSLVFILFCFLPAWSQGRLGSITVIPYSVTVDQPAYVGEPIWVHAEPTGKIHYPFRTAIGDFGCNRLELMHDGTLIAPQQLEIRGDQNGALCGWVAPRNAPVDRLPLHIWFPSLRPGKYALRWVTQSPDLQMRMVDSVASDWTTFVVQVAHAGQRQAWLHGVLASVPSDPGTLTGDYIPNLVAAAPDVRALRAIAAQLYSENQVVALLAASALHFFPQDQVNVLIRQLAHEKGPSEMLARLICAPSLREDRSQFVADNIRFLDSHNNQYTAPSIEALGLLVHYSNEGLSGADIAAADVAILRAAPGVVSSGNEEAKRQLALYLGMFKAPEAQEWLWKVALAGGSSAEQARIALTWNPQPDDLPHLAAMLLKPGDPDPTGRDLSSIPYAILHGYGDNAIPWLEKAVNDSPYVWVRAQAAEELARRNDPVAFPFFLDAIEANRFYRAEMIRFLKDTFPSELSQNVDDAEIVRFLKKRSAQDK